MEKLNQIRKSICEDTIAREMIYNNEATQKYYNGLLEGLSINNFPLIEVNTIEKKTYMFENRSNKQCYLVFDHYLLESIDELNQIVLQHNDSACIEAYYFKTMAEECYSNNKINLSIKYASCYLNMLGEDINQSLIGNNNTRRTSYLFIQQAFLIAHELFHFILHQRPSLYSVGIKLKRHFIKSIYDHVNNEGNISASLIQKAMLNNDWLVECLCDSTGFIQTIDVVTKLDGIDEIEVSLASVLAIMNQFTIATIQSFVKKSGDISYQGIFNLFNSRLLHFKTYASQYIDSFYSESQSRAFQIRVEEIYHMWLNKIQRPIINMMWTSSTEFKQKSQFDNCAPEVTKRTKLVLQQIFNT